MEFAPDRERNDKGWIIYPSDTAYRKSLFPPQVMKHPAKMQMWLEKDIIEYVSNPGDIILDPFGGTGTLMIAALMGRTVILMDIEESYHKLQQEIQFTLKVTNPDMSSVILLHGDNRFLLPIPCSHIITSPPYAGAMDIRKVREGEEGDELVEADRQMVEYSKDKRNISKLNTFLYNQAMERVYKLCYESLLPGGTLSIVVKDRIEKGKRVYLSKWVDRVCKKMGFTEYSWFKWQAPGSRFTSDRRAKGLETVDDEDIMIYRKEK
ncbi:hypothetical protein LCGC14_0383540 [marine sediment metagenome]|uniref:DNA methylase N-4/N-6 domain-containing protein n=1 Tax=marine sediment metagenome TaxID=412755 RepID=A0A0F9T1M4_9ZZZZ